MGQDQFVADEILPRDKVLGGPPAIDSAHPISHRPWKSCRLLWVDDSRALLSLYRAVFESLGFEVLVSSSPEEALRRLSRDAVDVAILDYDMPEMDGGMLAWLMKNEFPMLPVILYTGSTCIPSGTHRYVDAICTKAAPREELLAVIERLARQSVTGAASSGHFSSFLDSSSAQQA